MDEAIAQLQRSRRDLALWQKAQQDLLSGQPGGALRAYQELAKRYATIPQLWFELGNAAAGELDFALANQAYARALRLAPQDSSLLTNIGQQYQGLRQLDDARKNNQQAVVN